MSLPTLPKVQKLQRVLYVKAKESADCRFYSLYDKICRLDVLWVAYRRCLVNQGAEGVDVEESYLSREPILADKFGTYCRPTSRGKWLVHLVSPKRKLIVGLLICKSSSDMGVETLQKLDVLADLYAYIGTFQEMWQQTAVNRRRRLWLGIGQPRPFR